MNAADGRELGVLIVDDHPLIRRGIRAALTERPHWRICAEADAGDEAIRLAAETGPDLVVLDYSLPVINGVDVTRRLCRDRPGIGIVIFTMYADERTLLASVRAGARGYVLKTEDDAALLRAMDAVAAGGTSFPVDMQPHHAAEESISMLTPRELEVIRLVALGETNRSIAGRLNVSIKTVDTHRTAAMRKLGLHTAIDVALFAVRNGIIVI